MNNKGEMNGLGTILIAFVAVLIGVAFFGSIGSIIASTTGGSLVSVVNETITSPALDGTLDLAGQELVGTPTVQAANDSTLVIPTTNYTITEGVGSDGLKGLIYTTKDATFAANSLNVSYDYYPDGYIDSSGGRSLALLIPIFLALAIALAALVPALRSGVLDMFK